MGVMSRDEMKRRAERMYAKALASGEKRTGQIFYNAANQLIEHENSMYFRALGLMNKMPVTIDEFIDSKEFIGDQMGVWPTLRDDLRAYNPDVFAGEEAVHETVDGGATGTGKTHKATITQLYQLYLLTCFKEPVLLFPNLSRNTPIVMMFQSVQDRITRRVIYEPFRKAFLAMPYTQRWVTHDKYRESTLKLDIGQGGVEVAPALANLQSMVGQAIIGGIIDEVNFMSVVENSKNVAGPRGQGGLYDQAEIVYTNISRRRKGRFATSGISIGTISVLSSTRYKGDFLDRRQEQIRDYKEKHVVMRRRAQYEVQPDSQNCKEFFSLLVGSNDYGTTILKPGAKAGLDYPEGATVLQVPEKYRTDFQRDPEGALRDVCGIATDVIAPFITQRHKIVESVMRGKEVGLVPMVHKQNVELSYDGLPVIDEDKLPADRDTPRYVHIDLSRTGDATGIAMSKVAGFMNIITAPNMVESLPYVQVELACSIKPTQASPIDASAIRAWVLALKQVYKLNIRRVTYDGYDSRESVIMLRKAGIQSGMVSMDTSTEPYEVVRDCLYQDRLDMVDNDILRLELSNLEMHEDSGKVDHPPKGSKDISDAVAGSVYSAVTDRSNRTSMAVVNQKNDRPGANTDRRSGTRR